MQVLKIAGVSILALGLVLGLALPGLAAPDSASPWADDSQTRVVKGKVLNVVDEEFDIQAGEQELTISVDGDTKYFKLCVPRRIIALARHRMELRHQNQIPQLDNGGMPEPKPPKLKWLRPFGERAEFSDIAPGDRVVVWLANGDNLAKRVLIIKPTTYASVSGTIMRVTPDEFSEEKTITIAPDDDEAAEVTLYYNEGTVFILRGIIQVEEQFARAIYYGDSDNLIAKWVVVHELMSESAQ